MHQDSRFILESSNKQKVITLFFLLAILLSVAATVTFSLFLFKGSTLRFLTPLLDKILIRNIDHLDPVSFFYFALVGGLFFLPSPTEALFVFALTQGQPLPPLIISLFAGIIVSELINYLLGLRLGQLILPLISIRKMYKAKRWVTKYGAYAIFLMNLLPILPSQLLTFALGVTKYNFLRLFFFLLLANVIKYAIILLAFSFF